MFDREKLLQEISEAPGVSGFEKYATRVVKKYFSESCDEIFYDNLGSIIGKKVGDPNGIKVLVTGHVDEVGFVVKSIDEAGYLRVHPLGGWWPHVLLAQPITLITREGKHLFGVFGAEPPHGMGPEMRNRVKEIKDLYIDLGVSSKKEVEELGVQIGDPIIPLTKFRRMNNPKYLYGKAWDDRIALAAIIEALNNSKDIKTPNIVFGAGTVQEEVGLRGARTVANLVHPDVALAVDVTMCYDLPTVKDGQSKLNTGVALSMYDGSVIAHTGLLKYMENLCKKHNIKFTYDGLSAGGTDSGELHKAYDGVVNMTLSIPCRYFHSHSSIVHENDYEATVALLTEFFKDIDAAKLESIRADKQ